MHSFDGRNGTTFHHNSDLSGSVIVVQHAHGDCREITFDDSVRIDGADLLAFVVDYIRYRRIGALEQASVEDIILGKEGTCSHRSSS